MPELCVIKYSAGALSLTESTVILIITFTNSSLNLYHKCYANYVGGVGELLIGK